MPNENFLTFHDQFLSVKSRLTPHVALALAGHSNQVEIGSYIAALQERITGATPELQAVLSTAAGQLAEALDILNRDFRPDLDSVWALVGNAAAAFDTEGMLP